MDLPKNGPRYAPGRTRDLRHRARALDPWMDLDRRLRAGSFLPVVARVFRSLADGGMISGKDLAKTCRCTCRSGAVWGHLRYLADKGVLTRTSDGMRTYFSFAHQMDADAERAFRVIGARVEEYWDYFAARGPRPR